MWNVVLLRDWIGGDSEEIRVSSHKSWFGAFVSWINIERKFQGHSTENLWERHGIRRG